MMKMLLFVESGVCVCGGGGGRGCSEGMNLPSLCSWNCNAQRQGRHRRLRQSSGSWRSCFPFTGWFWYRGSSRIARTVGWLNLFLVFVVWVILTGCVLISLCLHLAPFSLLHANSLLTRVLTKILNMRHLKFSFECRVGGVVPDLLETSGALGLRSGILWLRYISLFHGQFQWRGKKGWRSCQAVFLPDKKPAPNVVPRVFSLSWTWQLFNFFPFSRSPTKIEELTAGTAEKNTVQLRRRSLLIQLSVYLSLSEKRERSWSGMIPSRASFRLWTILSRMCSTVIEKEGDGFMGVTSPNSTDDDIMGVGYAGPRVRFDKGFASSQTSGIKWTMITR